MKTPDGRYVNSNGDEVTLTVVPDGHYQLTASQWKALKELALRDVESSSFSQSAMHRLYVLRLATNVPDGFREGEYEPRSRWTITDDGRTLVDAFGECTP